VPSGFDGGWSAVGRVQIDAVQQGYEGAALGLSAWAEFWYRTRTLFLPQTMEVRAKMELLWGPLRWWWWGIKGGRGKTSGSSAG
jgi:hypothetical protein